MLPFSRFARSSRRRRRIGNGHVEALETRTNLTPVVFLQAMTTAVVVGGMFDVQLFAAADNPTEGQQVVSAFVNIGFDSSAIEIISISHEFAGFTHGTIESGQIKDFGGIELLLGAASPPPQLVGTVSMRALTPGSTVLTTAPSAEPLLEITVLNIDGDLRDVTAFENLTINVFPLNGAVEIAVAAGESVIVQEEDGLLRVRRDGIVDHSLVASAATVVSIDVMLSGPSSVDLSGIAPESFPALRTVSIVGSDGGDTIVGSPFDDRISGNSGHDVISAGRGNDSVSGGDGNDSLFGGGGNDTLYGNSGSDQLVGGTSNDQLNGGDGNDWIRGSSGNDQILGGVGSDSIFGGRGRDTIQGNDGDDIVLGGGGRDKLEGNDGADTLSGGGGKDDLAGGLGADTINGVTWMDSFSGHFRRDFVVGGQRHEALSLLAASTAIPVSSLQTNTSLANRELPEDVYREDLDDIDDAFVEPLMHSMIEI